MWLFVGEDVTSHSEIKQPVPPRPTQQRGAHSAATRADRLGGDGTDCAPEWLNLGAFYRTDKRRQSQGRGYGGGQAVGVYQEISWSRRIAGTLTVTGRWRESASEIK